MAVSTRMPSDSASGASFRADSNACLCPESHVCRSRSFSGSRVSRNAGVYGWCLVSVNMSTSFNETRSCPAFERCISGRRIKATKALELHVKGWQLASFGGLAALEFHRPDGRSPPIRFPRPSRFRLKWASPSSRIVYDFKTQARLDVTWYKLNASGACRAREKRRRMPPLRSLCLARRPHDRFKPVGTARPDHMADAGERHMGARDRQFIARGHVEHLAARRDRLGRVDVKRDGPFRMFELEGV